MSPYLSRFDLCVSVNSGPNRRGGATPSQWNKQTNQPMQLAMVGVWRHLRMRTKRVRLRGKNFNG